MKQNQTYIVLSKQVIRDNEYYITIENNHLLQQQLT